MCIDIVAFHIGKLLNMENVPAPEGIGFIFIVEHILHISTRIQSRHHVLCS